MGDIDGADRVRLGGKLPGRFGRRRPSLDLPSALMKKIGGRLADVAATGDQNSRHGAR